MRSRRGRARLPTIGELCLLGLALGLPFVVAPSCDVGGVVGGECRPEFVCDGVCVDLLRDDEHCGECGESCGRGLVCSDGECVDPDDVGAGGAGSGGSAGNSGDAGSAGDASPGGAAGDSNGAGGGGSGAGPGSGGAGDGGDSSSGGAGGSDPTEVCLPPFDEPWKCGDCDTECGGNTPLCAPEDDTFVCVQACAEPLRQCADQCVDTDSHPLHCGGCDRACASGICEDGDCVGTSPGHVVVMCMSYEQVYPESAQVTLLGNAVFHRPENPVRILAYGQYAKSNVRTQVNQAIAWAAEGRRFEIVAAGTSSAVTAMLDIADYDVFLVYDQPNAPAGVLGAAGSDWASELDGFARAGGVVIVMSGGTGRAEMDELVSAAGLLPVSDETDATFQVAYNHAPGDIIGANVVSPLVTLYESCSMTTTATPSASTIFVVTDTDPADGTGRPIVVHRIVAP
jgi:hypothetical protein